MVQQTASQGGKSKKKEHQERTEGGGKQAISMVLTEKRRKVGWVIAPPLGKQIQKIQARLTSDN